MWAVNSPSRPRKPVISVHPAVTLSTISSAWTARRLSTDGADTRTTGHLASADTVPDHLPGIDDPVEPLFVDVAGLERGVLQSQALVIRLVGDRGRLVVADHRAEGGDQHQRAADHLVDALAIEPRPFHGEAPQLVAGIAEHPAGGEGVVDDDGA